MQIYLITNKRNGKAYVGQTTRNIDTRWREHCLTQGKCRILENAIKKYGVDAFEVSVVATVGTQEELNRLERLTCEALNTYAPHGYNLREGGGAKGRMHEQTKQIMRELALRPERVDAFAALQRRPDVRVKMQAERVKNGKRYAATMLAGRTSDVERRRIEATTQTWADPVVRAAQAERQRRIQARAEVKEKKAAGLKAHWDSLTPEQREARGQAISKGTKGVKKRIDRSAEAKAKRSALRKALWADPEHRARMLAANSDPAVLKRRGDAIRAGHARNKAERLREQIEERLRIGLELAAS